jgi:hypothetical protein
MTEAVIAAATATIQAAAADAANTTASTIQNAVSNAGSAVAGAIQTVAPTTGVSSSGPSKLTLADRLEESVEDVAYHIRETFFAIAAVPAHLASAVVHALHTALLAVSAAFQGTVSLIKKI